MPRLGISARAYPYSNTVLSHVMQHSAQEQAPMAKTCKQVAAGKPNLPMLPLSSWGWGAPGKAREMFPVTWSLHLFLNLFCKGHSVFKQSLCLLYPQRLGLQLALLQLCSVEKRGVYLTDVLEYSFRGKKKVEDRFSALRILLFCFPL